jgi:type II secretory pathway component PulF
MKRVSIVIEPILVALIGGVVGGAVLALYLPTFRVMELL